jgi:hypothetical protein
VIIEQTTTVLAMKINLRIFFLIILIVKMNEVRKVSLQWHLGGLLSVSTLMRSPDGC